MSLPSTDPLAGILADTRRFPAALLRQIGFDAVLRLDAERCLAEVRYRPREEFAHSGGTTVQGGLVTAWLDNAMAFALAAGRPQARVATLEIKVSFLGRAGLAPVVARAWVRRAGRSVAFMEAELRDAAGEAIACASSTCKLS